MKTLTFIYISLSGNTHHFVTRLADYLHQQHDLTIHLIHIKDLNHQTFPMTDKFIAFLPTYLEGGNGIDTGDKEILTNPLRRFIASHNNARHCLGIVGSGNRNFNHQYCLTAKQYARQFQCPLLGDFELRGTSHDIERIATAIVTILTNKE